MSNISMRQREEEQEEDYIENAVGFEVSHSDTPQTRPHLLILPR